MTKPFTPSPRKRAHKPPAPKTLAETLDLLLSGKGRFTPIALAEIWYLTQARVLSGIVHKKPAATTAVQALVALAAGTRLRDNLDEWLDWHATTALKCGATEADVRRAGRLDPEELRQIRLSDASDRKAMSA